MTAEELFDRLAPLNVCAAIPREGGDWSYLLWLSIGRSWWAGDHIPSVLESFQL